VRLEKKVVVLIWTNRVGVFNKLADDCELVRAMGSTPPCGRDAGFAAAGLEDKFEGASGPVFCGVSLRVG